MKRHPSAPSRPGFTLIEMLLVISLLSAFSLLAIKSLALMMDFESTITTSTARELVIQRLEDQFRQDVQAAQTATESNNGITLALPSEEKVIYQVEEESLRRTIPRERKSSRDRWGLTDHTVTFAIDGDLITMEISPIDNDKSGNREMSRKAGIVPPAKFRSVHVHAILGHSLRYDSRYRPVGGNE